MLRAIRMCLQPIVANGDNTPRLLVFLGCASDTTFTSGIISLFIIRQRPGIISQIEIKSFYCNRHVGKEKANMMMSESRCVLFIIKMILGSGRRTLVCSFHIHCIFRELPIAMSLFSLRQKEQFSASYHYISCKKPML